MKRTISSTRRLFLGSLGAVLTGCSGSGEESGSAEGGSTFGGSAGTPLMGAGGGATDSAGGAPGSGGADSETGGAENGSGGATSTNPLCPLLSESSLDRIALCACLVDSTNGPILDTIVNDYAPQAALWYGDAVYADTTDPTAYRNKWLTLGANPRFQALQAQCPQFAVWDDHDYGVNNGDATSHPNKAEAQQIFQDFWGVPAGSPQRQQEGVYQGFLWGPVGKRVQVLMLDVRYSRSPFGPSGTMLGDAQWAWLSACLDEPADLRIIVSGVPWIATTEDERWSLMPNELERFYALIRDKGVSGVLLVSGDDHAGEVCRQEGAFGYDAYDFTFAGLDRGDTDNVNPARITPRVTTASKFGFISLNWTGDPSFVLGCQIEGQSSPEFEFEVLISDLTA